jgi:hypothetical protein
VESAWAVRASSWKRQLNAPEGGSDRVRSALTQAVKVIGALKVNVHAIFLKITSNQLPFPGSYG